MRIRRRASWGSALFISLLTFMVAAAHARQPEGWVNRSFENQNVGKVTLTAPKNWEPIQRDHVVFGTTFYRLLPPTEGQFDLELQVNDLKHMKMEGLVEKDLEMYIESNMADAAPQSIEGKVTAVRFAARRDAVYARLTDKAPKSGEFVLFTQGVRLVGDRVVPFTLYSNDRDRTILDQVLKVAESVTFVPAPRLEHSR
jgi:hypothetical protein